MTTVYAVKILLLLLVVIAVVVVVVVVLLILFVRYTQRWEDNIEMYFKEILYQCVDWIPLAQDKVP
jgi:type II secretory pathway pseudopilin PulG